MHSAFPRPLRPQALPRNGHAGAATELRALLAPHSIAVVGASRQAGTIGHQITQNLIHHGFAGAVYPVNPYASAICSVRAYPNIDALPEVPELAVIVVPQPAVFDVAEACCDAGVKGLVVISAGFREVGDAGAVAERRLTSLVRARGVRMVGPNCMGIVNADPGVSMNATFARVMPPYGSAAFVSQSGALGLNVLDHAREYGLGISQFVSVGNKSDVSGNDLLEAWEHDAAVRVILMYVESFGNPQRFLEIASRITKTKPIIVVKGGRSASGARAASSHTGALAASDTAVDAMLTQAGVLRAASIEELFDLAVAFGVPALPRSRRTAVLTNAGGPAILAADALEACGLELPELSAGTVEQLRPLFPAEASIRNPLDMIVSATAAGYGHALRALLADPAVDAVVPIFVPPLGVSQESVASAIALAASGAGGKPVLAVLMGREGLPEGRADVQGAGVPAYVFPESAARALAALNRQAEWMRRPTAVVERLDVNAERATRIIARAVADGRAQLSELDAFALLDAYRIPCAPHRIVTDPALLGAAALEVGYPLVMKIVSPDITHKTDVGGVVIGISNERELTDAFAGIMRDVGARASGATITGVLLQRMVHGGVETIAGITRDRTFGALVMFGLGGIFVEAVADVVFRMCPIGAGDATDMVNGLRGARLLTGLRGRPAANREAIERVLQRLAQLALDHPQIVELDVNPLLALPDRVVALDARVRLATNSS